MLSLQDSLGLPNLGLESPLIDDYVASLQQARKEKHLGNARQAHLHACNGGLDAHVAVGNYIVPMFVDCGSLCDAQHAFDRMIYKNEHSWTSLIIGYNQLDRLHDAFYLYHKMQENDVHPTSHTFVSLFKACTILHDPEMGREIHDDMIEKRFNVDLLVGNTLVGMYAKCNWIPEAQDTFNKLPSRSVVSWNVIITGYAEHGLGYEALNCLEQMQLEGMCPDEVTYACCLKACGNMCDVDKVQELHMEISQKGLERDIFVGSSLVGMYSKCGLVREAQGVFDELLVRDAISWNALVAGYAEHGSGEEALQCYERMQIEGFYLDPTAFACSIKACSQLGAIHNGQEIHMEITLKGVETDILVGTSLVSMYATCGYFSEAWKVLGSVPNRSVVSLNAIISGYAKHGFSDEVLSCSEQVEMDGILPDAITLACCMKACSSLGVIKKGQELHNTALQRGLETDLMVSSSLVEMYIHLGLVLDAWEIFDKLPVRSNTSWTALIAGHVEHGHVQQALDCYEQMLVEGILPTTHGFACILKACSSTEDLQMGQKVHMQVIHQGHDRDLLVCNALVDVYAECGALLEAREVFGSQPARNLVSWTALITGYAEHGSGLEALECFDQMCMEGIQPDAVTFSSVLKACTISEILDKGREVHNEIELKGLDLNFYVANALVGLYINCGSLLEANNLFDKLHDRNATEWTMIIAGYANHGLTYEALEYYGKMQSEGLPSNAALLACILNTCGSIGAIDKAQETHCDVLQKGLDKDDAVGRILISMYFKFGLVLEAQNVFENLHVQDIVAWTLMLGGYGMNHQGNMALQCFEDMHEHGIKVDCVAFTSLFTACSHAGLVCEGLEYFKVMREKYGVVPTKEHYTSMVDLLARSGHLHETERFVEMLCPLSEATWTALLSSCKTYGELDLAWRSFFELVQVNREDGSWYAMMADICANTGGQAAALNIEGLRKYMGANKKPAEVTIELNSEVHKFQVGDKNDEEVSLMLKTLNSRLKEEGHLPCVDSVLRSGTDREREAVLCEHAEKLAICFGLLHSPQGQTLRVTKNMRMCIDCHNTSKIISRIEKREIVLRDDCCIHHFKDGLCSCGDMF